MNMQAYSGAREGAIKANGHSRARLQTHQNSIGQVPGIN